MWRDDCRLYHAYMRKVPAPRDCDLLIIGLSPDVMDKSRLCHHRCVWTFEY